MWKSAGMHHAMKEMLNMMFEVEVESEKQAIKPTSDNQVIIPSAGSAMDLTKTTTKNILSLPYNSAMQEQLLDKLVWARPCFRTVSNADSDEV